MLKIIFILLSFAAYAEDFRDFLNPRKDVVMCGRFVENFHDEIYNKQNYKVVNAFKRVSWEAFDNNTVYVIKTGPIRQVFHLHSNEFLEGEEAEDELMLRLRYHVLKEEPGKKGVDLEQFYKGLSFEASMGDNPRRPPGWEYFDKEAGYFSAQEVFYSSQCHERCFVTMVVDKELSNEKAKVECERKMQPLPR